MMTDERGQRPDAAPRIAVADVYHGVTVVDPYRWMETEPEQLAQWLKAQSTYYERVLSAMSGHATAQRECAALSGSEAHVVNLQVAGDYVFYLKRAQGDQVYRLMARSRSADREHVVADPEDHLAGGGTPHVSIDWYSASPDGQFVAYAVSPGGSEHATLHVAAVATGARLPARVPAVLGTRMTRVRHPGVSWHPDSTHFVYQRLTSPHGLAKYQHVSTEVYHVGAQAGAETAVGVHTIAELGLGPDDVPIVTFCSEGRWLVVGVRTGTGRTCPLFARELGRPGGWRRRSEGATAWQVAGDRLYVLEPGPHGRGRLTRAPLASAATAAEPEVLLDDGPVTEDFCVSQAGAVLLRCLAGGLSEIVRLNPGADPDADARLSTVSLPHQGSVTDVACDASSGEQFLGLASWTKSVRILRLAADADQCVDTGWLPRSALESPEVISRTVMVPASDGADVPMTIVYRADMRCDGSAAAVITAYGFFGITLRAAFTPAMAAWVAAGGVWAIAHVRGGGEGGEAWARAGHGTGHERSIADLLDCADHLVRSGRAARGRLAVEGASAGGLTAAGAMVRDPGKFAAVVLRVPVTNTLRLEMHENGPPNVPEYGSVTDPEGLASLLTSDVCHRVREGTAYPPVLVTMGQNDPRVTPFQPAKLVAHLQHASTSGHPVLLRVERHAGHGPGSTKDQLDNEAADRLTFLRAVMTGHQRATTDRTCCQRKDLA
jgi:prolyl oligopeptidase